MAQASKYWGLSLSNIIGQGCGKIYSLHIYFSSVGVFNFQVCGEGGGGGGEGEDVSTTKSIRGEIYNHENLINQV